MVSQKMCINLRNIENAQDIVHAYLTMNREGITEIFSTSE